jgi:hypothetical protein
MGSLIEPNRSEVPTAMSTFAIQEIPYLPLLLCDHAVITMWDFVRQEACLLRTQFTAAFASRDKAG